MKNFLGRVVIEAFILSVVITGIYLLVTPLQLEIRPYLITFLYSLFLVSIFHAVLGNLFNLWRAGGDRIKTASSSKKKETDNR